MRIVAGLFGFGKKETPKRFTSHKDSSGNHYVKDSVTGFQRSFPDKETADLFANQQSQLHDTQKRLNEGGGPSLKNGLRGLGRSAAKVAVPALVGGGITYGFNRLNKKLNTPAAPKTTK